MAPVKKILRPLGKTFIAQRREAAGMTQETLADLVNMSRSGLSKIETSDAPYTQRTLEAIAEALHCQPVDLLMPDERHKKLTGEKAIKDLLRKIDGLSEDAIHPLWRVILGFLEDAELQRQTDPHDQSEHASLHRVKQPLR